MKRMFFLGTCIFRILSADVDQPPSERTSLSYNHRINFNLSRFGYEHIKPDSIYIGTEGVVLLGYSHNLHPVLGNVEAKVGYNFALNSANTLTPFIGGGYFASFETGKRLKIFYSSLGTRYEHAFGNSLSLGLNLEGMMGYSYRKGGVVVRHGYNLPPYGCDLYRPPHYLGPIWGLDVSLPFTWKFTKTKRWDLRLEPFFTGWFYQGHKLYFGGLRNSFGYRF